MRLLLDTHVLIWSLVEDKRLRGETRSAIEGLDHDIFVSAASAWEIEIKRALGKLDVPRDLGEQLAGARFSQLPITVEHAVAAGSLPLHHRDLFDRMLVAQAQLEGLTIVTRDPRFEPYSVALLPA